MPTVKARRRPVRAATQVVHSPRPGLASQLARAAASPQAKAAYVVLGAAGLAALAVAVIGPKRVNQEILKPLRGAVGDQAERLWGESRDLRRQIAGLFERAGSESGREKLVRNFQSWAGHFRAG